MKPRSGPKRWVLINASPEAVFNYIADLPHHGEWDAQTGFRVVQVSGEPVAEGSVCQRERIETFQAPILRGGSIASPVSWVRSLTVTGCVPNTALDFETRILFNGLEFGVESVSFRLYPDGASTQLVMTSSRSAHMPGPFYVIKLVTEMAQDLASRLFVGWLFRLIPRLRSNGHLTRIKAEVERRQSPRGPCCLG